MFDNEIKQELIELIKTLKAQQNKGENLLLQFPNTASDMVIPPNSSRTVVDRTINGRLRYISVTVPENCTLTILNNNLVKMFFSNEAGTLEFPQGLIFEDTEIIVANTSPTDPARLTYRMIFDL